MAAAVGKYAAKKMLAKQLNQYKDKEPAGLYDPYYEYRIDPRTGRKKKYKKQIAAYIPEHDANVLASVRKTAYRLDCSLFEFAGIRFGISSVIGLVPAIGDSVDGALALNTIRKCNKIEGGLPKDLLFHMLIWVVIDFVVGLVPFVGDLLDASIKCNSKNCRMLEQYLDKKYKPEEIDRREREERESAKRNNRPYDVPAPATVYEEMSDDENLPSYKPERPRTPRPIHPTTAAGTAEGDGRVYPSPPARPEPARAADGRRGERRPERASSNRKSDRTRRDDVEAGRR